MSGRKENVVSAKILDPVVPGLNNEPDQETTTSEIGTTEVYKVSVIRAKNSNNYLHYHVP